MHRLAVLLPLLISCLFLAVHQLAQPPANLKPKVFVLGLSKTGTTSIGNALELLGYKRLGWKDIKSRQLVHTFINGDYEALLEQTKYYDAFEDLPWPYMYAELAQLYPDAKFILSLRKDEQTWYRSLKRHMSRNAWKPTSFFYGSQDVEGQTDRVLTTYRNHTDNVRRFFKDMPERYVELVVDNDSETNWASLCHVAQCPEGRVPLTSFPRSNTIADWKEGSVVGAFHLKWGYLVTQTEELFVDLYYHRKWPLVNAVLERTWQLILLVEMAICNVYFKIAVQTQPPLPVAS